MGEVSPLNELLERYADKGVVGLTIYVREPHPGECYSHHTSWEQKLQYARECLNEDGIRNPVLVDDLEGTVHRRWGGLPNMVYVVDKEGRIVYKAAWTDHREIESVLDNLVLADESRARGARVRSSYSERINYISPGGDEVRQKVFDRAGPKAWEDSQAAFGRSV